MSEWTNIVFRTIGAIVMLFTFTRILGKKQISQLTFFEYVAGITLGELAGFISTDMEANYWHGVTALILWFLFPLSVEYLTLKSITMRHWFEGKGTVMIKDGKVLEDNLKKERFSGDELMEQLRKKSVFRVADVEFAILEASGEMNVLLTKENQPLTPKHLGIKVAPEQEPQCVIMDGVIVDEPLATIGYSREWLMEELDKLGVAIENVFMGQVDAYGQLFVDLFDDQIKVPEVQTKALLLSTLKKCEVDLELFSLTTQNMKAKKMYSASMKLMGSVITELTPILKR